MSHQAGTKTTGGDNHSRITSISANGRFVVMSSIAGNLVDGFVDEGSAWNVFLQDRQTNEITLVSRKAGQPRTGAAGWSDDGLISADGRFVLFRSSARDLIEGFVDGNGRDQSQDVFLFERSTGHVSLVSRAAGSVKKSGNGESFFSGRAVSDDGRWIVFSSVARNLVPGFTDSNGEGADVYLFDRLSGGIDLLSHRAGDAATGGDAGSGRAVISGSGGVVAFASAANDLVAGFDDNNGPDHSDVYLARRSNGRVTLVSHAADDAMAGADAANESIFDRFVLSRDGSVLIFPTQAGNLVPGFGDHNGSDDEDPHHQPYPWDTSDIFAYFVATGRVKLVSRAAGTARDGGNGGSSAASVSDNGMLVAFESRADDLIPAADVRGANVYLYDLAKGQMRLVSHVAGDPSRGSESGAHISALSGDGGLVVFGSDADDLAGGVSDANGRFASDIFSFDVARGAVRLVSHVPGAPKKTGNLSSCPELCVAVTSRNGRVVAFESRATDLVGAFEHRNGQWPDVYVSAST